MHQDDLGEAERGECETQIGSFVEMLGNEAEIERFVWFGIGKLERFDLK